MEPRPAARAPARGCCRTLGAPGRPRCARKRKRRLLQNCACTVPGQCMHLYHYAAWHMPARAPACQREHLHASESTCMPRAAACQREHLHATDCSLKHSKECLAGVLALGAQAPSTHAIARGRRKGAGRAGTTCTNPVRTVSTAKSMCCQALPPNTRRSSLRGRLSGERRGFRRAAFAPAF